MRRLLAGGLGVALVALALGATPSGPRPAGGFLDPRPSVASAGGNDHRAAVVIDNGSSVRRVCIRFSGTLTGIEALQRAAGATLASFGGLGHAVCAIDGLGCPADQSCLTCRQPKYWAYSRAPAGSGGFTVSGTGAGASTVRDGDVEGWRWGGGTPPRTTVGAVCGEAPSPPPPPSPPVSSGGGAASPGASPPSASGGTGGSGSGSAPAGGASDSAATDRSSGDGATTTSAAPEVAGTADESRVEPTDRDRREDRDDAAADGADDPDAGDDESALDPDLASDDGGSGSWVGVTIVAAVLVLAGVGAGWLRHRRRGVSH